jgi:RNA polymerase sigma-70 factor, ECF subfamily
MKTDSEVISRVLGGNARVYAVLVDRYKDRAFALAWRILKSREEAEESVQDAFTKAFHSLGSFRGDAEFGTWFYRILYNGCMTRVSRRAESMLSLHGPDLADDDTLIDPDAPDLLEGIVADERYELLQEEIQKLPEKFRVVISLFYGQEQRYEEIAAILGVPVSTVKTHLFRARTLLRKRVNDKYKEEQRAA